MFRRDFFRGLFGGAAALELPEVKSVEILRLEPDDTIVVTLEGCAHAEQMNLVKNLMESKFPGQRILVKDSSIDISIIRGRQ